MLQTINTSDFLPWVTTIVAVGYALYLTYRTSNKSDTNKRINNAIDLDNSKVVHNVDIEDLDKKTVFCRCWKSKKFPYCDGSHAKHNEQCSDNVGPLIIQKKDN
ncbi:CDGSH iron-sulfur domain-containing protein 1 [Sarcoptes scabiei]|uniref:CDGSH iron-sulfur domain-containing protein 1 n=1 Tax=Sarcoptes scabiei TaxID=52283 RepID=A0A834R5C5_SARSC|nr:CDGSH iron-sulfur domain-containing protein 1 [Sarcoptes scabiei]UXI14918.1 protein phosphatase Slingshot [Sarcoptes scabiei]